MVRGGAAGGKGVLVPPAAGASCGGRGGNAGRVSGLGGTGAGSARPSVLAGTGRIRKVVSEAVAAGGPVRGGGTEGRALGLGGTAALPEAAGRVRAS
ncbi:hypothetical protein ACH3VS_38005 [Streptomyces sp. WSLK1-3]|uniref:hypothetical protein n=1 Tax=Streptomyces sp. WSLK1-3 TaxID=3375475 RepID=UPI0037B844E0